MRKRRGGPRLDPNEPSTVLSVRVPASVFDQLDQSARNERQTLAAYVRARLTPPRICKQKSETRIH